MIPQGCRCKGLSDLRWRLGALLFAGLGRARPPALFFPSGTMSARNSPDNPCRGRTFTKCRLVAIVRGGLSLPIHLYSVNGSIRQTPSHPRILLNKYSSNPSQAVIHPQG